MLLSRERKNLQLSGFILKMLNHLKQQSYQNMRGNYCTQQTYFISLSNFPDSATLGGLLFRNCRPAYLQLLDKN